MKKIRVLILFVICFPLPGEISALMPPKEMEKRNLEAKLILVGEVTEMGKVLLPEKGPGPAPPRGLFVLKVLHVVKGYGMVHRGGLVRIVYRPAPTGKGRIVAHRMGVPPVEVQPGNLVVVYIEPSRHRPFYRPLAGGSSVVIIKPSISIPRPPEKRMQKK